MKAIKNIKILWSEDEMDDLEILKEEAKSEEKEVALQARKRLASYENNEWYYQSCQARAEIVVCGICQDIWSGGLNGIESDTQAELKDEVESEEIGQLSDILQELGFDPQEIELALPEDFELDKSEETNQNNQNE